MPIFEYHCDKCGTDFEQILLSRKGASSVACPSCKSSRVVRKLSTFGVSGSKKSEADFGSDFGGGDDLGSDDGGDDFGAEGGCGSCAARGTCNPDDFD